MSYSISYSPRKYYKMRWHSCTKATPYDDWVARGRQGDAIFTYSAQFFCNTTRYYFMPAERLVYMSFDDYYHRCVTVVATILIDDRAKTIEIDRLQCARSKHGYVGGIAYYKSTLEVLTQMSAHLTFDLITEKFFAPNWTVNTLPLARPKIQPELVDLAEACPNKMGDCWFGPWSETVGTYLVHRNVAATVIQKHYRGWKVRMATTFNPTTAIGAYYALRDFRCLVTCTVV